MRKHTVTRGSDLTLETPADPAQRKEMGSVSDYNVYADNTWTPWMRHNWNDNNTLAQWQARFGQDLHSRLPRIEYQRVGTQFKLLTQDGLDVAGPLPEEVTQIWRPQNPKRVGADVTAAGDFDVWSATRDVLSTEIVRRLRGT